MLTMCSLNNACNIQWGADKLVLIFNEIIPCCIIGFLGELQINLGNAICSMQSVFAKTKARMETTTELPRVPQAMNQLVALCTAPTCTTASGTYRSSNVWQEL